MTSSAKSILSAIGPGIIYAAAAVGISHLVQSTRAGADYGLTMTVIMLVIFLLKYPALRFGADYAAITGDNLIDSYYRQGHWVIYIFTGVTLLTMLFVMASLSLVTAGLFKALLNLTLPDILVAGILLAAGSIILIYGHYRLLELLSKILVPIFSLFILITTVILIPEINWSGANFLAPEIDTRTLVSIVLLAGFMPTPVDGSVLQSLWTCAKFKDAGTRFPISSVRVDFNIGYVTSLVLAFCFLLMGTVVLHNSGVQLANNSGAFASQVISLFTTAIGGWAYPLIAVSAFTVMLSTLLTILDGYPRTIATVFDKLSPANKLSAYFNRNLNLIIVLNSIGSIIIMLFLMKSFQAFIDLTSALVFITAPLFAVLNHRAIFGADIPKAYMPGRLMRIWSLTGIIVMAVIALMYIYLVMLVQ